MNYHNITTDDMLNGSGLRVTLWVSGCSMNCRKCHNPQTHKFNSGIPFTENDINELFDKLNKPYISGLTLSGGHPLEFNNLSTVYNIVKRVKERFPDKSIWIYSGYTFEQILEMENMYNGNTINPPSPLDVIKHCDILVDGKYIDELRDVTLAFRGSSNQRIIDIQKSLSENRIVIWDNTNT